MEKHNKEQFTTLLLKWYEQNARILPWREDCSAYRIWVSEIMLQQTRVEAVKPFFERFISEIPTIEDLAYASDDTLHKLWEGLGYYHRVKNMKRCAIQCVEENDGKLPSTAKALKLLPGIGDYTAGAIASIAFKEGVPAIDGNVLRVFSRVLISEDDILKESTKRKFHSIVLEYIPPEKSDAFNQALMELGALICVPNAAPRCNICPVSSQCLGCQNGDAHRLPNKAKKKARRIEEKTIIILLNNNKVYLRKRAETGLLAGLYEFITIDGKLKKIEVLENYGELGIKNIIKLQNGKHIFSHVEWHMSGFLIEVENQVEGLWASYEDIQVSYAIPTAFKLYKDGLEIWMKEK